MKLVPLLPLFYIQGSLASNCIPTNGRFRVQNEGIMSMLEGLRSETLTVNIKLLLRVGHGQEDVGTEERPVSLLGTLHDEDFGRKRLKPST